MKKFLTAKGKYFIAPLLLALGAGAVFFFLSISRKDPENIRFEKYIDQIFQEELKGNTLNLHYTLAYPEDYGIKDYSVSLGTMKPEALKENLEETRVLNKKLKSFDSGQLSEENQIIYDIPVFRRSTRKFPAFLFFSFFVSSSVPRFFLYLQQIFNALSGLFLLEKFF